MALLVVLAALVPVMGSGSSFTSDEGAHILQGRAAATGQWGIDHPFPEADPTGELFPLELTEEVDGRYYPVSKHPLYPLLLGWLDGLGGPAAMVLLSVVGTWLAALSAACLTRRWSPRRTLVALWVIGLGSPLLFDAHLVVAHSLGAAAIGGCAVHLCRGLVDRRPSGLPLAAALLLLAILLRNEAVLFGLGLSASLLLSATLVWPGGPQLTTARRLVAAGALAMSTVAGYLGTAAWERSVQGGSTTGAPYRIVSEGGWLAGRWSGFNRSVLSPTLGEFGPASAAHVLLVVLVVVVALYVRLRPTESDLIRHASAAVVLVALIRMVMGLSVVTGLAMAFPFLVAGVLMVDLRGQREEVRILAASCALFAGLVVAVQYPEGGGAEWGGRFFHIALPVVVPVVIAGLERPLARLAPSARQMVLVAAAATCLCTSVLAVRVNHRLHDASESLEVSIGARSAGLDSASDPGGPVVVLSAAGVGRLSWSTVLDGRWLLADQTEELEDLAGRLALLDVPDLLLVSIRDKGGEGAFDAADWEVVSTDEVAGANWELSVLRRR